MSGPEELWRVHQNAPFPASCLSLSHDGLKLVQIDAAAGALLTASLRTDGVVRPLNAVRRAELERHRERIRGVLRDVALDADGRAYFERLAALSDLILRG